MEPRIQYAKTEDGVNIAYTSFGSGPPLLETPGCWEDIAFRTGHSYAARYYEALGRHFTITTYDRRGTGQSERDAGDVSLSTDLADMTAVAERAGLKKFALFSSFHLGPSAISFTAAHPDLVSHLILYGTYADGHAISSEEVKESLLSMIESHWGMATQQHTAITAPSAEPELADWMARKEREAASAVRVKQLLTLAYASNVTELLPNIGTPTLILHRRGVRAVPFQMAARMAALLPNASLVALEGRDHWPALGDSDAIVRQLAEFVEVPTRTERSPSTPVMPQGMTAILFLDIADSTALTTKLGDAAYRERERELDGKLRTAITEAGGSPVEGKVLGDGIMSVFTSASQAIDAAQRCRDLGNDAELPLHLGIHAGDVVREGNNVHGGAVQVAARVQGVSEPGEILVSATVRDLARTSAGVAFEDRGEHELKGIDEPQRLFAVRDGS